MYVHNFSSIGSLVDNLSRLQSQMIFFSFVINILSMKMEVYMCYVTMKRKIQTTAIIKTKSIAMPHPPIMGGICCIRDQSYTGFKVIKVFMLNSTEHDVTNAHKNKIIKHKN